MSRPPGKIRPPRKVGGLSRAGLSDEQEFNACWDMLQEALKDIHERKTGKLSFELLYRAAYKIVLKRRGKDLFQRVGTFEEKYFSDRVVPPILELLDGQMLHNVLGDSPATSPHERRESAERFLKGLRDSWERHTSAIAMISDIMLYLDRGQIYDLDQPQLYTSILGLYRDKILRGQFRSLDSSLYGLINAVILDLINMDRKGDIIDRNLIKRVLHMYEQLSETNDRFDNHRLYFSIFEPEYLRNSSRFYAQEVEELLQTGDASNWLRHTNRRLEEEKDRCETTIPKATESKILKVVEDELISSKMDSFLALETSGVRAMMDNERLSELRLLYKLALRVNDGIEKIKKIIQVRVLELGLEIERALRDADSPAQHAGAECDDTAKQQNSTARPTAAAIRWVDDVLKLKDKFDKLLYDCFDRNKIIESAMTKSFAEFINAFQRSSEFVSLYIDDNLKNGIRGKTEAEVDESIEKAIVLVRFLLDKDMFQRYYQKHLTRRLIYGKSESEGAEKLLISRMKQEIGGHFTQRFEGMFKDMYTSRDLTSGYRKYVRELGDVDPSNIDLSATLLTSNNWPMEGLMQRSQDGKFIECNWPAEIKLLQANFLKYYLSERNGRILTWPGSLGTATIKCVFPKVPGKDSGPLSRERRYELIVSTHAMVVLLLFNDVSDDEGLSLEEIQAKTDIPASELNRALASISLFAKARVLLKEPKSDKFLAGDTFTFNKSFVSKTVKIKAPVISAQSKVEGASERKETVQKNDESRDFTIDAAIVRIMKARKELAHSLLVSEVVNLLSSHFKPDVSMVKKRIEDLILREYLERVDDTDATQQLYRYLA